MFTVNSKSAYQSPYSSSCASVASSARKLRAKAQLANIGTSLALLGVAVPIYTMLRTKKHDREMKAKMEAIKNKQNNNTQQSTQSKQTNKQLGNMVNSRGSLNQQFPSLKKFRTKVEVTK